MTRTQTVDPSVSRTPLPLDATDLATVCVLCSHNCGLRVDVKDGAITDVRADETNPITGGYVCNKAFSIQHYVQHAQRVQHPLRRRADGTFERIDWDTAITEIAAKLRTVRDTHTPRAIALVGVGGQANHMDAPWALGFLRGIGSKRWFNAFAQEKTQHSLLDQWMFNASPATFLHPDSEHSKFMLVLGTNPKISNRGHNATDTFKHFADDSERILVVVDPRETETTRGATRHLRVRPGTDAYLLLAMAAVITQRGLADETFVRDHTTDFDALGDALATVDVAAMATRCGITESDLVTTATELATTDGASIFYDLGVEQTRFSTLISWLIRVLVAITGNVGNPGGEQFIESFLPPVVDTARVGDPELALASGIPAIRALGNAGMFSPTLVPEEILIDHPERIRAVIVEGSNPLLSYSDAARWREARERLDLLVVIEPAMTETALLADYVLPTPVGYEKWEIANFPKRHPEVHVQLRPPVVPGPPDALPEPEIYVRLAEALELFGPPPAELFELAAQAHTVGGAAAYLGTLQMTASGSEQRMLFWAYRTLGPHLPAPTLAAVWVLCGVNALLRRDGVLRTLGDDWAAGSPIEIALELFRRILAHPEGVEIAKAAEGFVSGFDDGRIRLVPEAMLPELRRAIDTPLTPDPAYPFVLAAGLRTRWTANTIQRDPAWRKGRGPHCSLNLSPSDAKRLGLANGDAVRVATPRGELTLPAQVDGKLLDGHVWMPNGFGNVWGEAPVGGNQNELTDVADRDPFTGIPHHRYVPCQLTRA
ncbi:MAG TPA: molybdopterin-dependent oxidoreductase [Candidatus Binatia bacterium]|jgi:anaerobic selenocysteine-containing dehydrogenase|nr:molybdopterin-dependent oxidoreductase [Candidatus Binatia bacterium]